MHYIPTTLLATTCRLAVVLVAALLPLSSQAAPTYRNDPQVRQAMEALRTENPAEIRLRWGDLTDLVASGRWVGEDSSRILLWREAAWLVPGAVMSYSAGHCALSGKCTKADWLIQANPEKSQLDYYTTNDVAWMKGQLQPDGSVKVGMMFVTFETVRFDRLNQRIVISDNVPRPVPMNQATATEVIRASKGVGGDPAAAAEEAKAAAAKAAEAPAPRVVAASAPSPAAAPASMPAAAPVQARVETPPEPPKPATVFGPFDAAAGNYYYKAKQVNLSGQAAHVAKPNDGELVLSTRFLSESSNTLSWAVRATDTPAVYEPFNPKTNATYPNQKARLLADGTLEMEAQWKDAEGTFRQVTRWRLLPSALSQAGERFRLNPDGTWMRVMSYADTYALSSREAVNARYTEELAEKAADEERYRRGQAMRAADARGDSAPAPQRSFAEVFASTLRQELQAKDAQQARVMAGVAASVRAGEQQRELSTARPAADSRGASQFVMGSGSSSAPSMTPVPSAKPAPAPAPAPAATERSGEARPTGPSAAGKPLTFILMQPMKAAAKSKTNPYCYSGVMTVPGPAGFNTGTGWGGSEQGAVDKAIAIIKSYYAEFQEKCRQAADGQLRGEPQGSPQYDFNNLAEPSRVQGVYATMKSSGPETAVEVRVSTR
jgi:hypothetical protein